MYQPGLLAVDFLMLTGFFFFSPDNQFRVKLEDIVGQQNKHSILKPKDHHGCAVKVTKLKEEKAQLKTKMEEVKDDQCVMQHKRMQMETEIANLR